MTSFEVKTPDDIVKALKALGQLTSDKILLRATRKAANFYAEALRRKVPISTGYMRDTVSAKRSGKDEEGNIVFKVSTRAWYIRFLEEGTEHISARHDMRETFEENKNEGYQIFKAEIIRTLKSEWKKNRGTS